MQGTLAYAIMILLSYIANVMTCRQGRASEMQVYVDSCAYFGYGLISIPHISAERTVTHISVYIRHFRRFMKNIDAKAHHTDRKYELRRIDEKLICTENFIRSAGWAGIKAALVLAELLLLLFLPCEFSGRKTRHVFIT